MADLGTMKLVPTSSLIDFSFYKEVGGILTDVVRNELERKPPRLDFPIAWDFGEHPSDGRSGPPPSDPAMLYLELPFANSDDESVCFSVSLEDVIDDLIDGSMSHVSKKVEDAKAQIICARLAARLRELANKLDNACSKAVQ